MNPFGPITPEQQQAIRALLQEYPHLLARNARETVLRELPRTSFRHAAWLLEMLHCKQRGEALPPKPTLDMEPAPPRDRAAEQARHAETRERLQAHFAGRQMQAHDIGLVKQSLFAGYGSNPRGMNR